MQPTEETYGELQTAFDHFNAVLFGNQLPGCLITLQRDSRSDGYFVPERFVNAQGEKTDEIALNPMFFAVVAPARVMQSMCHNMVHLWQAHYGTPGRRRYHNKEWAGMMESIGLMPSDTGEEGGRKVGEKMRDYVIPGRAFEEACNELLTADFTITWKDRFPDKEQLENVVAGDVEGIEPNELAAMGIEMDAPEQKSNRDKYTCPECKINAWGKPGLSLICGNCQAPLVVLDLVEPDAEPA